MVAANIFTGLGAAYGTAKSGIGIAGIGIYRPDLIMKVGATGYVKISEMLTEHSL
jgi:ATP synthase proteolipid subunit